jgi:hypothetical protein
MNRIRTTVIAILAAAATGLALTAAGQGLQHLTAGEALQVGRGQLGMDGGAFDPLGQVVGEGAVRA